MLPCLGAAAVLLLAPPPQELKSEVLDTLKSATVYVMNETGPNRGVGSGFLFLKRGLTGYILTCEHVVGRSETVKVVFWSGTALERTHTATVVSRDPERDLACLVVKDVRDLPAALDLAKKTGVRETETVFAAGFPFGAIFVAGQKNPEISIAKSSISSIRTNTDGDIVTLQLSGDINPGNSGGPLITAGGEVVGVIASKVRGTGTAFAVPPEETQVFLQGRIRIASFRKLEGSTPTLVRYEINAAVIDPLSSMAGGGIAYIEEDQAKGELKPGKSGKWEQIHPAMKSADLKIEDEKGVAVVEFTRAAKDPRDRMVLFQAFMKGRDSKTAWMDPVSQVILFEGAAEPVVGGAKDVPLGSAVELLLPDTLAPGPQLKLNSVIGGFFAAPDGSALYVLDLSDGKILKLNPDTLAISEQLEAVENAVAMTMSPDGKTIYVAASSPGSNLYAPGAGSLQVVATGPLKTTSTFEIKHAPVQIVATDAGMVVVTCTGQTDGMAVIDAAKKTSETAGQIYGGATLRLTPDQTRVYSGDTGISPPDFRCLHLRKDKGRYVGYDSPYHGDHPMGGEFEISPDGRYLVGTRGAVLRLSRSREGDLAYLSKIEPCSTLAMTRGCATLLAATRDGFIKAYRIGDFELQKTVKVDRYIQRALIDPARKKLHVVASAAEPGERHFDRREKRVAQIISYSLAEK
jgi:S1-C subfamily serine protease